MIYLVCVLYYILALVGIVMRWRFRRFTAADFQYNKSLNRKRILALFYCWGIFVFSIFIMNGMGQEELKHIGFLFSGLIILLVYIWFIDFFEAPFRPKRFKKKKPFK